MSSMPPGFVLVVPESKYMLPHFFVLAYRFCGRNCSVVEVAVDYWQPKKSIHELFHGINCNSFSATGGHKQMLMSLIEEGSRLSHRLFDSKSF